jgi:hypothetical protein
VKNADKQKRQKVVENAERKRKEETLTSMKTDGWKGTEAVEACDQLIEPCPSDCENAQTTALQQSFHDLEQLKIALREYQERSKTAFAKVNGPDMSTAGKFMMAFLIPFFFSYFLSHFHFYLHV